MALEEIGRRLRQSSLRPSRKCTKRAVAFDAAAAKACENFARSIKIWVGGTRTGRTPHSIPSTRPERVAECMGDPDFASCMRNDRYPAPQAIRAASAHVQFETIQPYSGRNPFLHCSCLGMRRAGERSINRHGQSVSAIKTHRTRYYELLQAGTPEGRLGGLARVLPRGCHRNFRAGRCIGAPAHRSVRPRQGEDIDLEASAAASGELPVHGELQKAPLRRCP